MVLITEELVRKRAEHNECEIFSLEELSLHQCDVEKIDHLDRWCRDLRILYLQSNLISKIEHLGRLKKLEYLNLALNNIEKVENLQGCENLKKLDLTLNFIGELTSLQSLTVNYFLEELYLTGNPCADFVGYRGWVISHLPQLRCLDCVEVRRSDQLTAAHNGDNFNSHIIEQQLDYQKLRDKQKKKAAIEGENDNSKDDEIPDEEANRKFWQEPTEYTPESRMRVHQHMEKQRQKQESSDTRCDPWSIPPNRSYRLQDDSGRFLNVNAPQLPFRLDDIDDTNCLRLELSVYRYLCTSELDVDVNPDRVTVMVRGQPFQLVLPEEVRPDSSSVQRSQTTGALVVTMPKLAPPPPSIAKHHHSDIGSNLPSVQLPAPGVNREPRKTMGCEIKEYSDMPDLE